MIYRVTKCLLIETATGLGTADDPCRIVRNYVNPKTTEVIDRIDDLTTTAYAPPQPTATQYPDNLAQKQTEWCSQQAVAGIQGQARDFDPAAAIDTKRDGDVDPQGPSVAEGLQF